MKRENQKDTKMDNQQERFELDLAWLAGILEGEGWVSLVLVKGNQKNKLRPTPSYHPNIGMVNCDFKIMDKVEEILIRLNIKFRKCHRKPYVGSDGSARKEKVEISFITHDCMRRFINIIFPYLIGEKKERCIKLLEYLDIRSKKPKSGINARYGEEEYEVYKSLYKYKGNRSRRSKILNDFTLEFEKSNKIKSEHCTKDSEMGITRPSAY
jgi:hypothetical protein